MTSGFLQFLDFPALFLTPLHEFIAAFVPIPFTAGDGRFTILLTTSSLA